MSSKKRKTGEPHSPDEQGGQRDRRVTDFEARERLHVDVGPSCNNNCIFCMEEDRAGRRARVGAITPEQIRSVIAANSFREELIFVSGEPTLNPQLLDYIQFASEQGFRSVGVISNGRRFSYMPYTRSAVKRGLNLVIISIHGGNANLHNGLTRTPGAFEEVLQGLINLSALKKEGFPLRIHTSTVLNRRNATPEALDELWDMLRPHVDQVVFNVMQPFGRGLSHFERLMMRYRDVAPAIGEFFTRHRDEDLPVYVVDIPHCCTEGVKIPDRARGFVERYVRYQLEEAGQESALWGRVEESSGGAPIRKELLADAVEAGVEGLEQKHRDQQEQAQKLRRSECDSCVYSYVCDGVWRNYVDRYGWEEFTPVPIPETDEK